MKKYLIVIGIVVLTIAVVVPFSYSEKVGNQFFVVTKNNVQQGEKIEMTVNVNNIDYNLSKITLVTDLDIDDVYEDEENVELQKEDGDIAITINKDEFDLDKINLYYTIPEETQVGTVFTIVATVTNLENEEDILVSTASVNVVEKVDEKIDDSAKEEKNINEKNSESNKNINSKESKNVSIEKQEPSNSLSNQQTSNNKSKTNSTSSNSKSTSSTSISNKEITKSKSQNEVTYNGSSNNYLSQLLVEGYSLNKEFNKESTFYFVKTESNVSSLNIQATAEESTATVCISGADNLKSGINKILISVTSESGEVRTYKICAIQSISKSKGKNITGSSEIASSLEEKLQLHATYYYSEIYVEKNQMVSQGENILQYTNGEYLVAPYDCVITEISVPNEEEQCTNKHYITISSTKTLQVQIKVNEEKIENLSVGDEATINVEALEKDFVGNITKISSIASKGYFTVTVEFENDGNVKIGMTGKTSIYY